MEARVLSSFNVLSQLWGESALFYRHLLHRLVHWLTRLRVYWHALLSPSLLPSIEVNTQAMVQVPCRLYVSRSRDRHSLQQWSGRLKQVRDWQNFPNIQPYAEGDNTDKWGGGHFSLGNLFAVCLAFFFSKLYKRGQKLNPHCVE